MGGTADAATGILGEMSKPVSWGMPSEKVCEKLKKKDKQICELRYGMCSLLIRFLKLILKIYSNFKLFFKITYREANWSEKCGFEKTQSSRFEENP